MGDRGVAIYFRLSGRKGPLAPSKVKHRAAPVEVALHALRQGIPRRGSAGELCVSQRQAKQFGNFQCIEHRPARRPCGVVHVTVPVLAGAGHADRTAILGHIGDDDDLRAALHAPRWLGKPAIVDLGDRIGDVLPVARAGAAPSCPRSCASAGRHRRHTATRIRRPPSSNPDSLIYCDGLFTILAMRRELRLQNAGILSIAAR
jgi:hypothetical protein